MAPARSGRPVGLRQRAPGNGWVDLRSDTLTSPTPAMRRAMASAEVGDDCYGEDPTVNALQEAFAERVGMPLALYVPSGTMANQLAIMCLSRPGSGVIAGRRQHVVLHERAGAARHAGVQFIEVEDADGTLPPSALLWAREAARHHHVRPSLVCVENTHMASGGRPWSVQALRAAVEASAELPVHLDGARLFNAAAATGSSVAEFASLVTTVQCCLSKGLAAPVGSVLAGPVDVIVRAREERAGLGGAMRQAGVIAAAGLVALREMPDRLHEDHTRARRLAEAVADRWPDAGLDPAEVTTNIVLFPHSDARALVDHLAGDGILAGTVAPGVVRLVTHCDVDDRGVARAVASLVKAP